MAYPERTRIGVLYDCSEDVYRHVFATNEPSEDNSDSEIDYPLTPPPEEPSGSACCSPERATFPPDLNTLHLFRPQKRRNVAVRTQPKGIFRPAHHTESLTAIRQKCALRIQQLGTLRSIPCVR